MESNTSVVVGKVMDILFGAAIKETGYMWNCSENVKNLKKDIKDLTAKKAKLQEGIDKAYDRAEVPGEDLKNWMNIADAEILEAKTFIDEEAESKKTCCNLPFCVNLGTLYHYGKKATKKSSSLLKTLNDGKQYENYAFNPLPKPKYPDLSQKINLDNINSHKSILEEIIRDIQDVTVQIVGIIGLGGVGKTTLANEVAIAMKDKFENIILEKVTKNFDTEKIKENIQEAATKIFNGRNILIILDDVWEDLKLHELGIPFGSRYMNCKILLTSRSRKVCEKMNAQRIISVNPLKEEEAWTLFKRAVGKTEWDRKLKQVALEIVEECGGLPLFLQAVANALKGEEIESWDTALNRLKAPIHGDVPYKKDGILQLKLSYDFLKSPVAKSCFLLCSMFPEDAAIGLERLAYYGLGLGIFEQSNIKIEDAKDLVHEAANVLKSSFLLLPETETGKSIFSLLPEERKQEKLFKMHDLVRDMAMLITSIGNDNNDIGKCWVESGTGLTAWPPRRDLKSYKKISLLGNKICTLPGYELVIPELDTLLIQDNELSVVPDEFFGGMEKLEVLDMSGNKISSLPESLKKLTMLRLLDLSGNNSLREISILAVLTCLEILKLRSTGITSIPQEIGQLINLRLLDVYFCEDLSYIAPGVISKLIWLEELYVGFKEGDCKFLLELTELKLLKILHILVPGLNYIPGDFHFENLTEFHIIERINSGEPSTHGCKRMLQIAQHRFPFPKRIMKLIQLSDNLHLWRILDLESIPAL
ncbi:putative P-loop containing nucleoside triphosphate hydrolase, leucine-rich repeat domain superfamily [Helianthus debilis subsp. tardiflorus]